MHRGRPRNSLAPVLMITVLLASGCVTGDSVASPGGTGAAVAESAAAEQSGGVSSEDVGLPSPASEIPDSLTPVRMTLNFYASATHTPVFWGLHQRYFAAEGVNLQIVPGRGSVFAISDVASGVSDLGFADGATAMLAIGEGLPVVVVGAVYGKNPFGVFIAEEFGVTSLEEVCGHTVVVSPGTPQTLLLPAALRAAGVEADCVELLSVGPPALIPTYLSEEGDAVATVIPVNTARLARTRPAVALPFADVGLDLPGYVIVAHRDGDLLNESPDAIAGLLRALYRSMAESGEFRDAAVDALVELNPNQGMDREDEFEGWVNTFDDYRCSDAQQGRPVGDLVPEEWEAAAAILAEFAELQGDLSFERFATRQFFDGYGDNPVSAEEC